MPRQPIASEYRTGEGGDRFPKIKLTDKGQKTRFTIFEEPWKEWVHYIKVPTFDDHGRPVKEPRQKRSGETYETYQLKFVSQPICLGDENILKEKGLDERNCPVCEASVKSGGDIPGPVQRFAVNVIDYALRGNTWDIKTPFSADIKVWAFTGRMYDEIEGIQKEIGPLREHDITLECEDPYWQRNKMAFKMEPGYKQAPQGYIKELLTTPGNKASDAQLRDACGREVSRQRLQDDCDHALKQWRKVRNEGGDAEGMNGSADLAGGIDALLAEETADVGTVLDRMTDEQKEAAGVKSLDADDPFSEFAEGSTSNLSQPPAAAADSAPASPPETSKEEKEAPAATPQTGALPSEADAAAQPASNGDDFSFDDLLEGI